MKRTLAILAFVWAFILVFGSILCAVKWKTWFKNPKESNYVCENAPNRIMLSLGENADNQRSISWRCDTVVKKSWAKLICHNNSDTIVYKPKGKLIETKAGKNAFYRVDFNNLTEGKYSYQVGNLESKSKMFQFTILPKDNQFTFAFIGDVQDSIGGKSDSIFKAINQTYPDLDFWMMAGDVIKRPLDKYWKEFYRMGDSLFQSTPMISSPGNHEYYKGLYKRIDKRWMNYFPMPKNGPKWFKGRACHWEIEDACIVSLDTDGVQGFYSYWQQFYWAKNILNSTNKTWKIVLMHHPIKSDSYGRSTFLMKTLFEKLVERQNVDLVLQGHNHSYSRYTSKNKKQRSAPVYVCTSLSPKFYDISVDFKADRLGVGKKFYQIVDITNNKLSFKTYQTNHKLYDAFSIQVTDKGKQFIDQTPDIPESIKATKLFYERKSKEEIEQYEIKVQKRKNINYNICN